MPVNLVLSCRTGALLLHHQSKTLADIIRITDCPFTLCLPPDLLLADPIAPTRILLTSFKNFKKV